MSKIKEEELKSFARWFLQDRKSLKKQLQMSNKIFQFNAEGVLEFLLMRPESAKGFPEYYGKILAYTKSKNIKELER